MIDRLLQKLRNQIDFPFSPVYYYYYYNKKIPLFVAVCPYDRPIAAKT